MNSPQADGHSPVGFPHSEISGSKPVSGSPELIAAFHVLRRLWLPRHPPYALRSLTLSLRHASSCARDSTRESRILCDPFNVAFVSCYPWTIRSRRPSVTARTGKAVVAVTSDASFVSVMQFSMNSRGRTACGETIAAKNFVELIGIEPTTSGLQSQRSPN